MQTDTDFDFASLPLNSLYIGGEWVKPHSAATIPVVSPISEKVIFEAVDADEADVAAAVAAARDPAP